jgi:hypothetical protein
MWKLASKEDRTSLFSLRFAIVTLILPVRLTHYRTCMSERHGLLLRSGRRQYQHRYCTTHTAFPDPLNGEIEHENVN